MIGNSIYVNKDEVISVGNQLDSSIEQLRNYLSMFESDCDELLNYVHGSLTSTVMTNKTAVVNKGNNVWSEAAMARSFLQERMEEYGINEEEAYQMLQNSISRLEALGKNIKSNFLVSLSSAANPWVGVRMNNGANGCVEAVTKMGADAGSDFLKKELNNGVVGVAALREDAAAYGIREVDFYPNSLNTGDIIVYSDGSHVVMYDGVGTGYYGNSSSQMQIVHGSNYYNMGELYPTSIIKTSEVSDLKP